MRRVIFFAFMALLCCNSVNAAIVNGSFESGFTGWTTTGTTSIENASWGINPTDGSQYARMSAFGTVTDSQLETFLGLSSGTLDSLLPGANAQYGSAIKQTVYLTAGETLTFNWNFLTSDEGTVNNDYADFAFWSLVNLQNGTVLAHTNSPGFTSMDPEVAPGFTYQTGWHTASFYVTTTGSYELGFGVVNVAPPLGVVKGATTLLVDNVQTPEPATMTIWGVGVLGCAFAAYRRKMAKG